MRAPWWLLVIGLQRTYRECFLSILWRFLDWYCSSNLQGTSKKCYFNILWKVPDGCSLLNFQRTSTEHSLNALVFGNHQGLFPEHSLKVTVLEPLGTWREHPGNIPQTSHEGSLMVTVHWSFTEHSENNSWTLNFLGTLRERQWIIHWTFRSVHLRDRRGDVTWTSRKGSLRGTV